AARRHCHSVNRSAGMLGQLHNAQARDARNLWYVRSHGDIVAFGQRLEHLGEGGGAALAMELPIVGTGPANDANVQPCRGARIDLAIAVTRYQYLGPVPRIVALDEWRHEMLAMPHSDDHRHLDLFIDIFGLECDSARPPDKPEVRRGYRADGFLERG